MRNSRVIGRIAAMAAVLIGVVAVAVVLVGSGGGSYTVQAYFQNASQIVNGNLVQEAGTPVGTVSEIDLTDNGQAKLTLKIDSKYKPLPQGVRAVVRQASLSGVANRYIDLSMPPGQHPGIPEGGKIDTSHTTTAVDLDQLFNTFDPKTRKALTRLIRGFGNTYTGQSAAANQGFRYLNPALASSSRLFGELNSDTGLFRKFVTANAKLVTDLATRQSDLTGLVTHLSVTTGAIGRQHAALADAIANLPPFMRQANTTFVNLRSTLDDLTPLVNESKPVAKKLQPFLRQLRPLAEDARPTVHDLAVLTKRRGANNDLIDATRSIVPVRDIAIGPVQANGKQREGAFPASTNALQGATPELAVARPYSVDLTGWFNDFGSSGVYDALGATSRADTHVNAFALINGNVLSPLPPDLRAQAFSSVAGLGHNNRCPGALLRPTSGSAPYKPSPDFPCDETQFPPGS